MSKNLHPEGVGVFAHFIRQDADRRSAIRPDPAFDSFVHINVFFVRIICEKALPYRESFFVDSLAA